MQLDRVCVPFAMRSQVQRSRQTSVKSPYTIGSTVTGGTGAGPTGAGLRGRR
jgi:hypothetical protein